MRSSQAARGLLTAMGKGAAATGADRAAFKLESDGVVTSSFADLSLSGAAFLAVDDAVALEAGSAARTALPAMDAAGRGADAATRAGTAAEAAIGAGMTGIATEAALCGGTAGTDAGGCGTALLADDMGAKEFGAALGPESSLKATPATASEAKPATSQTNLRGDAASAA